MYHGSDKEIDFTEENPTRGRYDVCLTDSKDAALEYGEVLHDVEFTGFAGGEGDIRDAIEIAVEEGWVGPETECLLDGPYIYLALDEVGVQRAMTEVLGVTAVEYADEDPQNREHMTVRVFEAGYIQ